MPTITPPTPTLARTVEPTKTPGPTGVELQSMTLDQLKEKYPELSKMTDPKSYRSAAYEFTAAMGINAEELGNLTPVLKTGPDGSPILGLTNADGYPVIIGAQQEDGTWIWSKPMIKPITSVPFGSEALDGGNDELKFDILRNVFNQWTVGSLSWQGSSPSEKDLNLEIQEWYLEQAIANNQPVNFMHLIYGTSDEIPNWLRNGNYNKEQLITMMQDHITDVMTKLRKVADRKGSDVPITYTVVNESVNASNFWTQRIGPEYVQLAFEAARKADPKAILLYNDYNHELPTQPNAKGVFEIVKNLKEKGSIDGVGMQMHFLRGDNINPNIPIDVLETGIRAQIDKYASIGLKTYITELDVDMSGISGTSEQKMQKAAQIYEMIARIASTNKNVALVSLWGVNSESSWINNLGGQREPALLFTNDKPQQTYYAVIKALFENLK
jgi:endo-1,4-beta-xylanase